jgi:hypothetical protein
MKPSIPDIVPSLLEYYRREGNESGGIFHVIVEDTNYEKCHARSALEQARELGDPLTIKIAEMLVEMSATQRRKLSMAFDAYQRTEYADVINAAIEKYGLGDEVKAKRQPEDDSSLGR